MSWPEMAWRVEGTVRGGADRLLARRRAAPPAMQNVVNGHGSSGVIRWSALGDHWESLGSEVPEAWKTDAVRRAEQIVRHRFSFFDLEDCFLGDEIDWNYEYKADRPTPRRFVGDIDYRDHRQTGDCKFVWEPNRHHHLVTLGRAYRYTGDERYADEALTQIESWIRQCPFGMGMNWRSPLELGIRLLNWVWTLQMIRPAAAANTARLEPIIAVAYRHLWDTARKYSRYSSANNHLIGEAAGVYIGAAFFAGLKGATAWRAESRELLSREILAQTHPDGGTCEQAFGYHLFVTQFFLLSGLVARNIGEDFPPAYGQRLEKMLEFVAALLEGGDRLPAVGDGDDGYVLDLGDRLGDPRALLGVGALLFDRRDFQELAGDFREPAYWLFGLRKCDEYAPRGATEQTAASTEPRRLSSRAFSDTGYYLLQCGRRGSPDAASVLFDCGPLGFQSIAAHGHADALSFTLRLGGVDVLVDPGTFDYFTYPPWRVYFRSTRAHNTLEVDGLDQSEMLGQFLWSHAASCRCLSWQPAPDGGSVQGEHDGYRRLSDPVGHRRSLCLQEDQSELTIVDELSAKAEHRVVLCLHFAEQCRVTPDVGRFNVAWDGGSARVEVDERLAAELVTGSENPIAGWVSRGYHRKSPTTTLLGRCRTPGSVTLRTRISWGRRVS